MPVESAADRAAFVNPDEFGAAASYQKAGGGAAESIAVLHLRPSARMFDGPGFSDQTPSIVVRQADLPPGAAIGDSVTVDGIAYAVRAIEPDGTGFAKLMIEEA